MVWFKKSCKFHPIPFHILINGGPSIDMSYHMGGAFRDPTCEGHRLELHARLLIRSKTRWVRLTRSCYSRSKQKGGKVKWTSSALFSFDGWVKVRARQPRPADFIFVGGDEASSQTDKEKWQSKLHHGVKLESCQKTNSRVNFSICCYWNGDVAIVTVSMCTS